MEKFIKKKSDGSLQIWSHNVSVYHEGLLHQTFPHLIWILFCQSKLNVRRYFWKLFFFLKERKPPVKSSTISEIISVHMTHLETHTWWPYTYTGHACAVVNRKQILYSGRLLSYWTRPETLVETLVEKPILNALYSVQMLHVHIQ